MSAARAPLVVLQSFRSLQPTTNPYLSQLVGSLAPWVTVRTFSWRAALCGRWDVLHVHWPEVVFQRAGRLRSLAGMALFLALLVRVRLGRHALVRTAHNLAPHEEQGQPGTALLALCDRWTTLWIRLNPTTQPRGDAPVVTILHGSYTDWFADYRVPGTEPGRLVFFGLIRPYKGVEELLGAFAGTDDRDLRLRLVGKPTSVMLADTIRAACEGDSRVGAVLGYVDDADLVDEVGRAELVVLPYRHMHNSGAALLALSLGRPVLVPANEANRALADEVGPGWVHLYEGVLDAGDLRRAVEACRTGRSTDGPDLTRRDWSTIGREHFDVYEHAVALVRTTARSR